MSLIKEFREFAVRGNVIDLAVGVVVGAAFGKIVSSLVSDVIMPPIGVLVGGVDFTGLTITLKQAEGDAKPVLLRYGVFLQTIFDFLVIAGAIFALVKVVNRLRRAPEPPAPQPPEPPPQERLLGEIRDLLKQQLEKRD